MNCLQILLSVLRLMRGRSLLLPAMEHVGHGKHLPGGRSHGAGMGPQAAQKEFPARTAVIRARVVDIYRGSGGLAEVREANAKLGLLDAVAGGQGGYVKGDGPPVASLLAAWKRRKYKLA